MTTYFYGLAANPLTLSHESIVKRLLGEGGEVVIGVTDHDYKKIDMPFSIRKQMVDEVFAEEIAEKRIEVVKQDKRTWAFLSDLPQKIDVIVMGEDEWRDLRAGKWRHAEELLRTYDFKVIPRADGVSSTEARKLLKADASYEEMKDLVSESVYKLAKSVTF